MNRTYSLVLFAGLVASAASACIADTGDEGMVILKNVAPGDDGCVISPEREGASFGRGALDTVSPLPYTLAALIESRITSTDDLISQRTVALRGARVDLEIGPITVTDSDNQTTFSCTAEGDKACFSATELDALASAGTTKFRSLFSIPLAPNGGLSTAAIDIVPTSAIAAIEQKAGGRTGSQRLSALAVAKVTVYGDLGGSEVSGVPFIYPVTVCDGCSVNFVGLCSSLPSSFSARTGNPCNPFQDGVIDCCETSTGDLSCPAVGTAP